MTIASSEASQALKDLRDALRAPSTELDTDGFTFLLSSTLQTLHLHSTSVPPSDVSETCKAIERYLPGVQQALLINAVPTYLPALDTSAHELLQRFFVPPRLADPSSLALGRTLAVVSYSTLSMLFSAKPGNKVEALLGHSREYAFQLADRLSQDYGIDELYWAVWGAQTTLNGAESSKSASMKMLKWEEVVKAATSLPSRVANAWGRWKGDGWVGDVPEGLTPRKYFDRLIVKLESLMYQESQTSADGSYLRIVFERLIALGLLNTLPSRQYSPTPSLLAPMLPGLLAHLHPAADSPLPPYPSGYLSDLFLSLPTLALAGFTTSLIDHLAFNVAPSPDTPSEGIKRAAAVLSSIIGPPKPGGEAWDAVMRSITRPASGTASDARVRMIVAWVGTGNEAVTSLIDTVMESWTDSKHIRYALYAQQFELTHTLLRGITLLPPYHPYLVHLSHRPKFLMAMQSYLAHPDPAIRRLGMLVAEIISERTIPESTETDSQADEIAELKSGLEGDETMMSKPKGGAKRLKFGAGMWEGQGQGREEARWLRSTMDVRDNDAVLADEEAWLLGWDRAPTDTPTTVAKLTQPSPRASTKHKTEPASRPKIVMLDEEQAADPMEGYANPSSSRSPSPTPSYLEEITADPSLALDAAGRKKIKRPVYISQLIALLKERDKPDHLEVGLKWGESLIRSKQSFGKELEENAVQLAALTVALNDPFNLENFDESRQGILDALVACSPKNVAPSLCELYFIGSYSLQQRSVVLTALAMGARELAGMSVPTAAKTTKIDFPSKTLPLDLHRKYISAADTPVGQIEEAIDGVRGLLLSKGAKRGEETVPELAREKRLRVGSKTSRKVAEVGTMADRQTSSQPTGLSFKDVAAECFILPLINRFWQYFQDASVRQGRAVVAGTRYRGAGTGLLLSPMALEKFLMTLALLLHAARHSSYFLAVLVPEALELAAAMGAQHLSQPDIEETQPGTKEASVVGAALELALVVLDASWDLDSGRTLAMDSHALLVGVGEWASGVFNVGERGERTAGQGGLREGRVRAAAAGVVVKVSDIGEKWGRLAVM